MKKDIFNFDNVYISAASAYVGKKEREGPFGYTFDMWEEDEYFGCKSFEDAETEMVRRNINILLSKKSLNNNGIDLVFGGDLVNQCIPTSYAINGTNIPFIGLYGACSTISEAIICASVFTESNYAERCVALASSHFCTAERQYRFPLEYGSTRTPTSQNTVTGAGAFIITNEISEVKINSAVIGRIIDKGITDANNMGAAMAGAAADTIERYINSKNYKEPDLFLTGDLGIEGNAALNELLRRKGILISSKLTDCGMIIYDNEKQDTHAGGSGCGCMASMLASHFYKMLKNGNIKSIFAVATGALLNPNTVMGKKSIPAIAHGILLSSERI